MSAAKKGKNEPLPPIIVKKVTVIEGGHHGGAWKVAYADFVTAMMAFCFLLLWLLGATTEKQRKGLADHFTPTLVKLKQESAGSTVCWAAISITDADDYPSRAGQTGTKGITIPRDTTGGPKERQREDQAAPEDGTKLAAKLQSERKTGAAGQAGPADRYQRG